MKKRISKQSLIELSEIMPIIPEWEMKAMIGGGEGTAIDPYTELEMDCMLNSGSWRGGYVESIGYVDRGFTVFGMDGVGYYYSYPEYVSSRNRSTFEELLIELFKSIPGYGLLFEKGLGNLDALHISILSQLSERGYGNDSSQFYVNTTEGPNSEKLIIVNVYDAYDGNLIISGSLNLTGYEI